MHAGEERQSGQIRRNHVCLNMLHRRHIEGVAFNIEISASMKYPKANRFDLTLLFYWSAEISRTFFPAKMAAQDIKWYLDS